MGLPEVLWHASRRRLLKIKGEKHGVRAKGFSSGNCLAIPRSWYRARKPLKPGNTKKIRKSPQIRVGPRKYEKNTEKIRKKYRKNTKTSRKMTVVVFFLYFFRVFGCPTRGGGFRDFFVFFCISGLEGFSSSIPGTQNRKAID